MKLLKSYFCLTLILCSGLVFAQEQNTIQQTEFPTSELQFESTIFNYGTIESGETVQNIFTFTNTGTEPILIINAKGSCGCTVPDWPREPIAPGETGEFVVRFDSKNKVGFQSKRVTITANTDPVHTYLTLKGEVIKSVEKIEDLVVENAVERIKHIDATDVSLYPNPTSEVLNVNLANLENKAADVFIYNTKGQLIDNKHIEAKDIKAINFDVSQYKTGIYTVSIKAENLHRIAKQVSVVNH